MSEENSINPKHSTGFPILPETLSFLEDKKWMKLFFKKDRHTLRCEKKIHFSVGSETENRTVICFCHFAVHIHLTLLTSYALRWM